MNKRKISHKELLTFSNLTNLEWEFVDLEAIKEGNSEYDIGGGLAGDDISTQLNDLLIPELFIKRNKEGEIEEYSYMEDAKSEEEITKDDLEEGIANMRHKAGVAMEYLEKSEGDFLSDWEVIYGGDKYKIMKDYLDQRWAPIYKLIKESLEAEQIKDKDQARDFLNQDLYPSREKIEEKHSVKLELQVMTKKLGINVAGDILDANFPGKPVKLLKEVGKFELKKIPNRKKLNLKGELCYNWENDYRWRVGKKKLLPGYGFIDDYQFKKLAGQQARPYKMYAKWSYYLSTKLNLLHSEVDSLRTWCWREFCSFEHV